MRQNLIALELQVLYEISRVIGETLDLEETIGVILRILGEELSMKRATVTLQDDQSEKLLIRASHGLTEEEVMRGVYNLDEGVTGRIFRTAKPFVVPDIAKEPLFLDKTKSRRFEKDKVSFIGVPIMLHGHPIGVLNVDRLFGPEVSFEEDIRFLTIVATLFSQVVNIQRQVRAREEDLRLENVNLKAKLSKNYQRFFIVGKSRPMARVLQLIEKVAPTKATVLLLGESGTGKSLIARIIHELSDRSNHTFTMVNCASLPETLLESELFGHEKGAFTGASEAKAGRFEEANKGTVFLDEIGEIPMNVQVKLLRFLQDREFERLGSTRTRKVDVRIVAATNKNLEAEVAAGRFREDLYYRLNVFPILAPPLRKRKEDIPALLNHFLDKLSKEYDRRLRLTSKALDAMVRYDWPGNVREMENLMERLSIMTDGDTIELSDIPSFFFHMTDTPMQRPTELATLEDIEKHEIIAALERNGWVQSRAARELNITLRQIGYRIKKFGLEGMVSERRGRH